MYIAKFHGQDAFGRNLAGPSWAVGIGAHLPQEPTSSWGLTGDAWVGSNKGTSFEKRLHEELKRIKESEKTLKKKMGLTQSPNLQQQTEFKQEYLAIEQAKKMTALIVEHMQRCLQNICANFR